MLTKEHTYECQSCGNFWQAVKPKHCGDCGSGKLWECGRPMLIGADMLKQRLRYAKWYAQWSAEMAAKHPRSALSQERRNG